MGYTIWYEGNGETPLTDSQREIIRANAAGCTLSDDAEDFSWRIEEDGRKLTGWTKPSRDMEEMESDMDTIIETVRALDIALDEFSFTVTDDFDHKLYP